MIDKFKRNITYMRVSLTELCNLRCRYCMPADGICKREREEMLTEEEFIDAIKAASSLGIRKIRLTGGEPLVKANIISICKKIKEIKEINELCITTNGVLLPKLAKDLKNVGVDRLNISLDTLNPKKYEYITRIGKLEEAIKGIESAIDVGFSKIKINVVLIGGFNDDEIEDLAKLTLKYPVDVRFIELMPMYDSGDFKENAFIPVDVVLEKVKGLKKIEDDKSVARLFHLDNAKGNIGLISPVSNHFCNECNRIRLTADGHIKPCLHSSDEISIKGLSYDEMLKEFEKAILMKPEKHDVLSSKQRSKANRNMNRIGG